MFEPASEWDWDPDDELAAGAVDLLAPEPSADEVAFMASLVAAETAALNDPVPPRSQWPQAERLADASRAAEVLTRQAQAATVRQVHALVGQVVADDMAYAGGMREQSLEFAADEVAAALGLSHRAAAVRMEDALALVEDAPRTLALLHAGVIAYPVARALALQVGHAPTEHRAEVEARVLDTVGRGEVDHLGRLSSEEITQLAQLRPQACWRIGQQATRGQVLRLARAVLAELSVEVAAKPARGPIDVESYPTLPGRMMLGAELGEADGCTILVRLHAYARLLKAQPGETRSMGELRVQAFRDLLLGHTPPDDGQPRDDQPGNDPAGPRAGVGPSDAPGRAAPRLTRLPQPVPFDVHLTVDAAGAVAAPRFGQLPTGALEEILAAAAGAGGRVHVRRITPKPCPGSHADADALAQDPDPRYPSASLAAAIRMRDKTCRFPGCTIPAGRCDLDHSLPWPHGPTCECNLCCLCRHHHRLKTHGRWKVTNHGNGHLTWTTPTGRTIDVHPDP